MDVFIEYPDCTRDRCRCKRPARHAMLHQVRSARLAGPPLGDADRGGLAVWWRPRGR
ncbi:hypothetical protein [Halobellus clavatus]